MMGEPLGAVSQVVRGSGVCRRLRVSKPLTPPPACPALRDHSRVASVPQPHLTHPSPLTRPEGERVSSTRTRPALVVLGAAALLTAFVVVPQASAAGRTS